MQPHARPETAAPAPLADPPGADLLEVDGVGFWLRLRTSAPFRRLMPTKLAVLRALRRGRRQWRRDVQRREEGFKWGRDVLGRAVDQTEVMELAQRALMEEAVKGELLWRPWVARWSRLRGSRDLRKLKDQGGVVLVTTRSGHPAQLLWALAARGLAPHIPRKHPVSAEQDLSGYEGWLRRQYFKRSEGLGVRFVTRPDISAAMTAVVEQGELAFLALDAPGAVPAVLGGREVMTSMHAAEAAKRSGAPVVLGFAVRRRLGLRMWLSGPVDPVAFDTAEALHAELARRADHVVAAHLPQLYPTPLPTMTRHEHRVEMRHRKTKLKADRLEQRHSRVEERRARSRRAKRLAKRYRRDA